MVLHREIGKLGEDRSRTKINVMLKEGTCHIQQNEKKREKKLETKLYQTFTLFHHKQVKKALI